MTENQIAKIVVNEALYVHRSLGPGLLESAYEECLFHRLKVVGLNVKKQIPLPLMFEEVQLEVGYRVDLMVENKFIVEIKSVSDLNDVHLAQILTY